MHIVIALKHPGGHGHHSTSAHPGLADNFPSCSGFWLTVASTRVDIDEIRATL